MHAIIHKTTLRMKEREESSNGVFESASLKLVLGQRVRCGEIGLPQKGLI